eukprot:TRINITY_DN13187_c0_g1_i1.p1 TRINITY_DN13187_c0_g1~~TRINITY_DN13187_c0_g1_i1.p1  ORF type:complete len:715 (+),score=178.44 TRINITY_DN13187_c0_g1_i1:164-2308(+)
MPIFKRKNTGGKADQHADLQTAAPVVGGSKKRVVDDPEGVFESDSQLRFIVCGGDDILVSDTYVQGGALAVSLWRRGVGRVGTHKVREVHQSSDKCCALAAWEGFAYIGCFDGMVIRMNLTDQSSAEFIAAREEDKMIEQMCAGGQPGAATPELLFVGTTRGTVRVHDADSAAVVSELRAHGGSVRSLCWVYLSRMLVSCGSDDASIRCWRQDGASWIMSREINSFLLSGSTLSRVAWDHDAGTLAAGDSQGNLYFWTNVEEMLVSGADMSPPKVLDDELDSVENLYPHGGDIVSTDKESVRVHDANNGHFLRAFLRPEGGNIADVAVGAGVLYTLEPRDFPKCHLNAFDLPPRKVKSARSNTSSPLPVYAGSNSSFGGASPTQASAVRKTLSVTMPLPPAAGGRSRTHTTTKRASMDGRPPPQPPDRQTSPPSDRVSPNPVHIQQVSVGRTESDLRAERAARTQGSIDFDDLFTNRSMAGAAAAPQAAVSREASRTGIAAPPAPGPGPSAGQQSGSMSEEITKLFSHSGSGSGSHPGPSTPGHDAVVPPAVGSGLSGSGSGCSSVRPSPSPRVGEPQAADPRGHSPIPVHERADSGLSDGRRAGTSQPSRAAPRPPTGPPPAQDTLVERVRCLEHALQLLGGTAQLTVLKQKAAEEEDYAKAKQIKSILDVLARGSPMARSTSPQAVPPAAPAPKQPPQPPAASGTDPLAGFF